MSINAAEMSEAVRPEGPRPPGLATALDALAVFDHEATWQLSAAGLEAAIESAGRLRRRVDTVLASLVTEAHLRGVPAASGLSHRDWLASLLPDAAPRDLADLTVVAQSSAVPVRSGLVDAVTAGVVTVGAGAALARFSRTVEPVCQESELARTLGLLTETAAWATPRQLTRAVRHAEVTIRPDPDLADEEERLVAGRGLFWRGRIAGLTEYRLLLDPEATAIVEAALDPLSAAQADPVTGGRDPRSEPRRRADALLELVSRAVGSTSGTWSGSPRIPNRSPAQVMVTIAYDALASELHRVGVLGEAGTATAATIRRLACDADILPAVLGSRGQLLDLGRATRLVTPGQRRALWHRDRGCTYPGCSAPPWWTDAHHIEHWSDGGVTALSNLTLLCRRHHGAVHRHGDTATVDCTAPPGSAVTWDLTLRRRRPGSEGHAEAT